MEIYSDKPLNNRNTTSIVDLNPRNVSFTKRGTLAPGGWRAEHLSTQDNLREINRPPTTQRKPDYFHWNYDAEGDDSPIVYLVEPNIERGHPVSTIDIVVTKLVLTEDRY